MIELLANAADAAEMMGPGGIWEAIKRDFANITTPSAMAAFLQVLMIDIVLAGDNLSLIHI